MPSEVRVRALVIPSRMAFTDRNPLNIYVDISAMYALNSCGVDYYTLGSLLCVASTLGFHVVCVLSGHTMRGRVPSGLNREIPLISYILLMCIHFPPDATRSRELSVSMAAALCPSCLYT